MAAFGRWRRTFWLSLGLLAIVLASSSGMQPLPPLPNVPDRPLPPPPTSVPAPSPIDDLRKPAVPATPPIPLPLPPGVATPQPPLPPPNTIIQPASAPGVPAFPVPPPKLPGTQPVPDTPPASAGPTEREILEPIAVVHRFTGRYLGGDQVRGLVYLEKGSGRAEVQNRPLINTIPGVDAKAADGVKRIEVPAGKVAEYDWRVFLTTQRELLVINADCELDWRFTLPGKPDNGEKLLEVAGFRNGRVFLLGSREPQRSGGKSSIHIFTLDAANGRLMSFATLEDEWEANVRFHIDAGGRQLFVLGTNNVRGYDPSTGRVQVKVGSQFPPNEHMTVTQGGVFTSTLHGIGLAGEAGFDLLLRASVLTAPPALARTSVASRAYFPRQDRTLGQLDLTAYDAGNRRPVWQIPVKHAIQLPPLLHGTSVYFVSGNTLYRVNAATGAICWKHTLPINAEERLTELTFIGGEVRVNGPGVLVRVGERPDPPAARAEIPGGLPPGITPPPIPAVAPADR